MESAESQNLKRNSMVTNVALEYFRMRGSLLKFG